MCKRTKHLSIQDDCWIFRIQAEDFTRGGDKFRGVELRPPSELCLHILCKSALYLAAKFITFPGKIQNLAAKLSNIATHKKGRNSILN